MFEKKQIRELSLAIREDGSLAKEDILIVSGVVVDEDYFENTWDNVWSFFYANGATVGGNEWERKYKREYVDNGRVYNPESGYWEYTEAAGGNRNPFECTYEAPQDYQGSVPVWDGTPMDGE